MLGIFKKSGFKITAITVLSFFIPWCPKSSRGACHQGLCAECGAEEEPAATARAHSSSQRPAAVGEYVLPRCKSKEEASEVEVAAKAQFMPA